MKGIIVSVSVLLQKMPSGSEKVLATLMGIPRAQITCQRSLTLGRNGLAVIPLLCSLIGWEQPESVGSSVNPAAELKVEQRQLAVFSVEGQIRVPTWLPQSFIQLWSLGVTLAISFSLISKAQSITTFLTTLPPKYLFHVSISLHLLHHDHHHLVPTW